ncbi:MAG: PhzF family phenazine biosynthesis protein [Methanobacteriota archaeon]|nr:MAG: PhzF family phenazine biosynthesis protein [Euryarchaeota archaeon]
MATKRCDYVRVDVFSTKPFGGNPLAVFPDARGLSSRDMQLLAKEMNLSETTFVLPASRRSGAEFRVRIFTPDTELPYAGHPTIGTFFVLAEDGKVAADDGLSVVRMEAMAGILPVEIYRSRGRVRKVVTVQKKPTFGRRYADIALLADALSLKASELDAKRAPPLLVSTGLPWLIVPVKKRSSVERISINSTAFAKAVGKLPRGVVDIYATCLEPLENGSTTHSRAFSLVSGNIVEDPATGSASGCLGAYLVKNRLVDVKSSTRVVNEQGYALDRPSRIEVEVRTAPGGSIESVRVGGRAVEVMRGRAEF